MTAILDALAADLGRLLDAGAAVAGEDVTFCRNAAKARQLAGRVPAFAGIADSAERLIAGSPRPSEELLGLLVVVAQARSAVASGGLSGTLTRLSKGRSWSTRLSEPELQVLAEALSGGGQYPWQVVEQASQDGRVNDLRLIRLLAGAFDLRRWNSTMQNAVVEYALPAVGDAVVPELLKSLNLQGGHGDRYRLRGICRLDPRRGMQLCREAVEAGSDEVREEALECLKSLDARALADAAGRVAENVNADGELRALALRELAAVDTRRGHATALRLLPDSAYKLQDAAAEILADADDDKTLDALVESLGDLRSTGRKILTVLANFKHPATTERLLKAFGEALAAWSADPPPGVSEEEHDRRHCRAHWVPEIVVRRKDGHRAADLFLDAVSRTQYPGGWSYHVRSAVVHGVAVLAVKSARLRPALSQLLRDADSSDASSILSALEREGTRAAFAVPELIAMYDRCRRGSYDRTRILDVLAAIGPADPKPVVDLLLRALREERGPVPHTAANALGKLGPVAAASIPEMLAYAKAGGRATPQVLLALPHIDVGGSAVPRLAGHLSSADKDVRGCALLGLETYGTKASGAVPALLKLMAGGRLTSYEVRVFHEVDPDGAVAIPGLVGLLRHANPTVRRAALEALGRYGEKAATAGKAVRELLADGDRRVRTAAKETLEQVATEEP